MKAAEALEVSSLGELEMRATGFVGGWRAARWGCTVFVRAERAEVRVFFEGLGGFAEITAKMLAGTGQQHALGGCFGERRYRGG